MSQTGYSQFVSRSQVHVGVDSILRLPIFFKGLEAKRIMLLSDPGVTAAGITDRVASTFDINKRDGTQPQLVAIYTETKAEASSSSINDIARVCREKAVDGILAVGGGGVMDTAKAVRYLLDRNKEVIEEALPIGIRLDSWPTREKPLSMPFICVPTTAGTGAEVTTVAVIHNDITGSKINLIVPNLESDIAVLDARLTVGLPKMLTVTTAFDALTHAIEAICSPSHHALSDSQAFYTAHLVLKHLPIVCEDPGNLDSRQALLQASNLGCSAMLNSLNATPVHNCAHALGALHNIPHGEACAVLLPILLESLSDIFYYKNANRLARALKVKKVDSDGKKELIEKSVALLRKFQETTGCPQEFKRHKINPDQVPASVVAVASDPAAILFSIPHDRIAQIVTKTL